MFNIVVWLIIFRLHSINQSAPLCIAYELTEIGFQDKTTLRIRGDYNKQFVRVFVRN